MISGIGDIQKTLIKANTMKITKLTSCLTMLTKQVKKLAISSEFLNPAIANIGNIHIILVINGNAGWLFKFTRLTALFTPDADKVAFFIKQLYPMVIHITDKQNAFTVMFNRFWPTEFTR